MSGNVTKDKATASGYLYEDDFSYVNAEGELYQKDNKHFEGRNLGSVDTDTPEASLAPYKEAFDALQQRVSELSAEDEELLSAAEKLESDIKTADAIGDFDGLLDALKSKLEAAGDKAEEESEKQESKETVDETEAGPATNEEEAGDETTDADDAEVSGEPAESETEPEVVSGEEELAEGISYYKEILEKAREVAKQTDWSYVSMELDNLSEEWADGPDVEDEEKRKKLYKQLLNVQEEFEKRRQEHYEELKQRRRENLEKKQNLLSRMQQIVDEEQWQAQKEVARISGKWENIKQLPQGEGEDLDARFEKLKSTFDEHKVDFFVKSAQQEEDNLVGKLVVLDKMEQLAKSIDSEDQDWDELEKKFNDLTRQWKKIGRVPKDRNREVWDRYKNAQDAYYDSKFKYNKEYRQEIEKNLARKKNLIEEAEALVDMDDLAEAARKVNKLHRRWKKAGNLPQKEENELWHRFKAATDRFNDLKSENIDQLREQEEENYEAKLKLIDEAEALKDTTDWKAGHKGMQNLMKRWKAAGPAPKKKSRKIWKKFKGAMDHFYDRRREHFKEVRKEQKGNLKEKNAVLDKLRELTEHEDPVEAVNQAKPLQEEFKKAGYVPIKQKNKIWKEYRKVCDIIYDRFRAAKSDHSDDRRLAAEGLGPEQRSEFRKMRKEYGKLKKEVQALEEEVMQLKDAKTYFKPSKKGNALRDEIQEKIDKADARLQEKKDELDRISAEMDDIRDED